MNELKEDWERSPVQGRIADGAHALPVRIYYEDTDFSGLAYHASYLRFLERGRTELLRALSVAQSDLHALDGFAFVVRRMAIDYLRPARMDDVVVVTTRPTALRGASLHLAQEVRRGDETLVRADVVIAAVRSGRPVRMPESLRSALAALEAA